MTPLKSVLLMRSVTFMLHRTPKAFDHLHQSDGLDLKMDPSTGAVVVSELVRDGEKDGKPAFRVGAEVYRVAPANVAGYAVAESQPAQGQQQAKGK